MTVGVMLPLLAAGTPWAPLMAWLIASPLISPNTFALLTGTLGLAFAITQLLAAVSLGLAAGLITGYLERTGWLRGQARVGGESRPPSTAVATSVLVGAMVGGEPTGHSVRSTAPALRESSSGAVGRCVRSCSQIPRATATRPVWRSAECWRAFGHGLIKRRTRRLVFGFLVFVVIASAVQQLVPTDWVRALFGAQHLYAVPLAALIGVPLYASNATSIPLVQSLVEMGMGRGPALALLIGGAGTSLPAMAGLLLVARWRVVALYVAFIFVGAVFWGYLVDFLALVGASCLGC